MPFSKASTKPLLYLIDGSSQMYRAFHAPIRTAEGTLLRNSMGIPTNAVYIFVTMLRKLIKEHQPELIAASFDLPGRTFRDDLAADYKANRKPMPDELAGQIPLVHRACEALGVPIITQERFEADDVIGTMAERARLEGYDVAIVTGDKDFFQLVQEGIRVYNPRDDGTWYDAEGVKEKFGVAPDQVVDVLALMGDTIDNVKGVPGIGEKGARDLIAMWGSLDRLLEHAAEVPQKKYREALLAHTDDARSSRELLRIHTDVRVDFDVSAFRYRGPSRQDCYELFSDLGFRSLVMEYAPTADTVQADYGLVTTTEELDALVGELRAAGRFGVSILHDGPTPIRANIIGIALSLAPQTARYVPLRHASMHTGPQVSVADALSRLRAVFEDPSIEKIGHDLKSEQVLLARYGVALRGLGVDTMIASYLLDATRTGHPLESVALEQLGYKAILEEELCGKGAKATALIDTPPELALNFACERADLTLQLADRLWPLLVHQELERVYRELEQPLIPVLAAIERAGVRVDLAALARQVSARRSRACSARYADLRAGRRAVQHQLTATAVANSLRQAAAPRAQAKSKDADAVDGRGSPGGAGAHPRAAASDSGMARSSRS